MSAPPAVIPVKVYVRSRPFNKREKGEAASDCLEFNIPDNQISCNGKWFTFDNVLDMATPQDTAYEVTAAPLLEEFFKGFHCTILAYGQTGSGKTYTMGTEETKESMRLGSRGIIPRLVDDMFRRIEALSEGEATSPFEVSVSMLEIYDEKIHDILTDAKREKEGLQAREVNGAVYVQGLSSVTVTDLEHTMAQLEAGCKLRSKGETAMNATSSRSHAIFTITMKKSPTEKDDSNFEAKLHLVDLAGSERLKKTQAEGNRMKEGIRINEGLLALGNVISALSEPNSNGRHIPYRDSKITRLLQDSLGGNSFTVMIACVSPADTNAEETLSTLRYADRAKKIKNKPTVSMDPEQKLIKRLKEENAELRRDLAEARAGLPPRANKENVNDEDASSSVEVADLRRQLAENETSLAEAQRRAAEAMLQRISVCRRITRFEQERDRFRELVASFDNAHTYEELQPILQEIKNLLDCQTPDVDQSETITRDVTVDGEGGETEEDVVDTSYASKFYDTQCQLDADLCELQEQIKEREHMMKQHAGDQQNYARLLEDQKAEVAALQKRIDEVTAEKNKIHDELKKFNISSKLAEDRRRKLQEKERELAGYKQKMNDFKKLEKEKVRSDEKAKKMEREITEMKRSVIQKTKQQREEARKYGQCKMKMERQMAQLKAKEQKLLNSHAVEKRQKDKEMAVMKMKLSEMQGIRNRLQKQQEKRVQLKEESTPNDTVARKAIKKSLETEFALISNSQEASASCVVIFKERKGISEQMTLAKRDLKRLEEEPASKKRRGTSEGVDSSLCSADDERKKEELRKEIAELEVKLELCNQELTAVQKLSSEYDPEARRDELIKSIRTVSYAGNLLHSLFDLTADKSRTIVDLNSEKRSLQKSNAELKDKLSTERKRNRDEVHKIAKKAEEEKRELRDSYSSLLSLLTTKTIDGDTLDKLESFKNAITNQQSADEMDLSMRHISTSILDYPSPRHRRSHRKSKSVAPEDLQMHGPRTRHQPSLYGDVRDPLKEVVDDEEADVSQATVNDSTFHCGGSMVRPRTRRHKKQIAIVLSPIYREKPAEEKNVTKRRTSGRSAAARASEMMASSDAAAIAEVSAPEQENVNANTTFDVAPSEALNGTFVKDTKKDASADDLDETSPLMFGLTKKPSMSGRLGPIRK